MSDYLKQLPSDDLDLDLSTSSGLSLPAFRLPDVKEPMPGRRGRELANEMREQYFRLYHQVVLERLAMESMAAVSDYAMLVIDAGVKQILDRYCCNLDRHPAAKAAMKEVTEACIRTLVATVKSILENHHRNMGGSY
jgi:hypothetical protein